jgi:hypothetical protein
MRNLNTELDLAEMLGAENAALFVFVDWSEYSRCGEEIFEEAETKLAATSSNSSISWWVVDVSSVHAPPGPALHRWLKAQEQKGKLRVFPNIAMGNGSVVWMKSGEVVRFEPNALRSGSGELVHRTAEILAES